MNRILTGLMALGVMTSALAEDTDPLSVLFVAGPDTHGWGAHDHNPSTAVLAESLKEAMGDSVQINVVWSDWPSEDDFAKADVCVIYSDGWGRSILTGVTRLSQIESFMNDGKGVLRIHWATGSHPAEKEFHRELFGGNMESDYSVHSILWNQKFELEKHPITSGMKSFELFDECYFHMRWVDDERTGVEDVLTAKPGPDFQAPSVTPLARELLQRDEPQTVAWVYNRPRGGRAFSYTGGHFHWDWANDNLRMMVLNAIVWAGGRDTPEEGLISTRPTAEHLIDLMKVRGNKTNDAWSAEALQPLLDQLNQPGGKINWSRPPFK